MRCVALRSVEVQMSIDLIKPSAQRQVQRLAARL